jgi:hypothetical protein
LSSRFSGACFQRSLTRGNAIKLLVASVLLAQGVGSGEPNLAVTQTASQFAELTSRIPPRPSDALTGSQFAASILHTDSHVREQAILNQVLKGNLPRFLRHLVPVKLRAQLPDGRGLAATVFVMPEYLSIGSNKDFLRIPMNLYTARAVAERFGFVLPTRKIVNAIYRQAAFHFTPQPLPAGPHMRSTEYYETHNAMIEKQSETLGIPLGALVSGDKKDVVLSNRLFARPGQIAIYGWHRAANAPIQPLSTVHGARYADYSHGIRLVSDMALFNGKLRPIYQILQDSVLSKILSDEGPIRNVVGLMAYNSGQ